MLFNKKDNINGYTVMFPHKQGSYAETYRVKSPAGKTCFLKLINKTKLSSVQLNDEGKIIEIEIVRNLTHPNICSYIDEGKLIHNGQPYEYFVSEFVSGETLDKRIGREETLSVYDMKQVVMSVLSALDYLHTSPNPIVHNEVTIQNVMLNLTGALKDSKLIDFGNAQFLSEMKARKDLRGMNLFYLAPERLNGVACVQSDLYSVGVMMYHLLYGELPWFTDLSGLSIDRQVEKLCRERSKPLKLPDDKLFEMDDQLVNIIYKALAPNVEDRFQSADDFIKALSGELRIEEHRAVATDGGAEKPKQTRVAPAKGQGFSAIAGMQELKDLLQTEVIDVLHNPEEYAKYGLTIPNGMLLYGPPGCGKTFFAKHFAEEVGFNFMYVNPSSLKSRYVNATQENIAQMFKEAEENAPTIIFIEEMNELTPNRDSDVHEMSKSAVNEMLAQMDRTGEKGIFIIGATNYPHLLDPAILRAGRMDKKYYLSPPDKEARMAIFEIHLKNKPCDFGLDYERLAKLTEDYVAADIDLIVKDAARMAFKTHSKITMAILEEIIKQSKPSVPLSELQKYARIKAMMDGKVEDPKKQERPKIGFI